MSKLGRPSEGKKVYTVSLNEELVNKFRETKSDKISFSSALDELMLNFLEGDLDDLDTKISKIEISKSLNSMKDDFKEKMVKAKKILNENLEIKKAKVKQEILTRTTAFEMFTNALDNLTEGELNELL